jgi:hypothetical protein
MNYLEQDCWSNESLLTAVPSVDDFRHYESETMLAEIDNIEPATNDVTADDASASRRLQRTEVKARPPRKATSIFSELKRRGVFHVATTYVVISWLVAQVAELVGEIFNTPNWVLQGLLLTLAIGLPIALIISWIFELTAEGLRLDELVKRDQTGGVKRCRILALLVIAFLILASSLLMATVEADSCVAPNQLASLQFSSQNQTASDFTFGIFVPHLNTTPVSSLGSDLFSWRVL